MLLLLSCSCKTEHFMIYRMATSTLPQIKADNTLAPADYRPLPLCRLRISRYYHLCRGDFSLPTFFRTFLCISTPSMSKMVYMKQRVSRGDFSCPRRILHYICNCLCRSKNRRSHGRHIVCFVYVHVLAEVRTSSKQQ